MQIAADLAADKARECQIAAVALTDVGHTGRLGQFVEQIAGHGMFGMILGGGNHERWACVAPYGGAKPLLPTNPYAFALPAGRHENVLVDFATSAVATGRLRLFRAESKPVPEGWILDKDGRPTTVAEDFFQGGMQLPAGGAKGYGLAVLAELIAESLLGKPREFNWLIISLNLEAFRPLGEFLRSGDAFLDELKAVPPASGFAEVLVPGEPERRSAEARGQSGIPVGPEVWRSIEAAARSVGLDADGLVAGIG
jgi:LDH2 family malate/lactate/ureidoglycolate dehydrogenase